MSPKYAQGIGLILTIVGLCFISFVYMTEPRSFAEVASKGQVALGRYEIDKAEFALGLAQFRSEDLAGARASFERADPERRDAGTQFYIAYSFYRQGWGRISNDDALFTNGLEAVNRAITIDPNFRAPDAMLGLKTASELKNELEEGLKLTVSDLNPFKLVRERK